MLTLMRVVQWGVEKAMAPHSSTLSWKIPWMEEPGRLQSMGSWRVGQDCVTSLSLFTFMHWRRKWQPTPVFLPGESHGWEAWWAAVYGVTQIWTWLKRLSISSSIQLDEPFTHYATHMKTNYSFLLFEKEHWDQYYWKENTGKWCSDF